MFVPNFAGVKLSTVKITPENEKLLETGYEARTDKVGDAMPSAVATNLFAVCTFCRCIVLLTCFSLHAYVRVMQLSLLHDNSNFDPRSCRFSGAHTKEYIGGGRFLEV